MKLRTMFVMFGLMSLLSWFTGCATTGERISRIREGMSRQQVEAIMGKPDGFKRAGDYESIQYAHRLVTGWAWDRADYNVILKNDRVVEYGIGEVRVKDGPSTILILVPLK